MKPFELILVILLSAGAIQGVIYGFILIFKSSKNQVSNRFLASILLFFSYRLIVEIFKLFGFGFYDIWYHLFLEFNWIYGALIYFFVKATTIANFKLDFKKDWIHFLPVILEFVWSNFIKSQNFYWDGTRESLSWLGYYGYILWMHYPTMYVISGLLILLYSYKSSKLIFKKNIENKININKINWVKNVLNVLIYYASFLILIVIIDLLFFDYAFKKYYSYPLFIGMAIITYWLGLVGFSKRNDEIIKTQNIISDDERIQLEKIAVSLKNLMKSQKLFLNPELNLTSLSKELGIKTYLTTKCLNVIIGKKFNDFINEYRIQELKIVLKNPDKEKYTLLSLAFEVGFNSKASFNRAVKKITGKSPKYLKSIN